MVLNPAGRIPVLTYEDHVLFESAAICLYLSEKYSNGNLLPASDSHSKALAYQWLMYLTNTLQAELMLCIYPTRHTTDEDHAASIVVMQEKRLVEILKILDHQIDGQRFLLGNHMSVCDFYLFMLLLWIDELSRPLLSQANLNQFLDTMADHDCVQHVCQKEGIRLDTYK